MASREETLLFIVDVQVRNVKALAALDAELDAALRDRTAHFLALQDVVTQSTTAHQGLASAIQDVNAARAVPETPRAASVSGVEMPGSRTGNGNRYVPMVPSVPRQRIMGTRGAVDPGSRQNPMAMAQESGTASGLGGLAAASAAMGADQSGGNAVPVSTPSAPSSSAPDQAALTAAAQQIASKVVQPEDNRVISAIEAASQVRQNVGAQAPWQGLVDTLSAVQAQRAAAPGTLTAGETAGRLGVPISRARALAGSGQLPGARKTGGQWLIPESAVEQMLASGDAGGAGGSGGGQPPVAVGGPGGPSGGSSGGRRPGSTSRTHWNPVTGLTTRTFGDHNPFSLGNLFRGDHGNGGAFGLPSFGSVGSFAGLGLEHWLLSGAGIAASAGSALGGAGLLGTAGLAKTLVGGGADALISHDTIKQAVTLQQNMDALNRAIAVYGKGSKQAAAAQYDLNKQIATLGGPQTAAAFKQLDKNAKGVQALFDQTSGGARRMSIAIDEQILGLARTYTPMVTAAAQRNLSIINTGLKPLFAWLQGPQGIQIFQTLENSFAQGLPTSIHAFSMGIEDFLRLMSVASQYTGGLSRGLDRIFTAKNQESTAQYRLEVEKLVGDLHEWEGLLKLLGQDLSLAFKQDAGTANSIVQSLTGALAKLHEWETSTQGQQQLHNIFAVHKQEILQLLQVFYKLGGVYGKFYMDVAPPLVKALTDVAGAFDEVIKVVEKIPGGTDLLGLALVLWKLGALGPALSITGRALGLIDKGVVEAGAASGAGGLLGRLGVGRGAAAATGAAGLTTGETVAGGGAAALGLRGLAARVSAGARGAVVAGGAGLGMAAEGAGASGLADAIGAASGFLAPLAAAAAPVIAAVGGVVGLIALFNELRGNGASGVQSKYTSNQLGKLLQQQGTGALTHPGALPTTAATAPDTRAAIVLAHQAPADISKLGPTPQAQQALKDWLKAVGSSANLAQMSATQLHGMVREGNALAQIFPKDADEIHKFTARAQADLTPMQNAMRRMTNRWNSDLGDGLGKLKDIFAANMRLAATVGGAEGTKMMGQQVQHMLDAVTHGIVHGKIGIAAGMREITSVIQQGAQAGGTAWSSQWNEMFSALTTLRDKDKISSKTYLSDVQDGMHTAFSKIKQDTESQYQSMFAHLKTRRQQGWLDQQQYNQRTAALNSQMNANESNSMASFVANLQAAMKASGQLTAQGMQVITEETNKALGLFGAAKLPVPQAIAWNNFQLSGGSGSSSLRGSGYGAAHATGAKVTTPSYMVGEEAPAHPEYVLATNPAYRSRNLKLWASAAKDLGVPGFAAGGVVGEVDQFFSAAGFDRIAIAGILGNAMQESSLNPQTPGGGMWQQITNFGSGTGGSLLAQMQKMLTQIQGLRAIMNAAGSAGAAAVIFEEGFEHAGTPNMAARIRYAQEALAGTLSPGSGALTGVAAHINEPKVGGGGPIADLVRAVLHKTTHAANSYLAKQTPKFSGGGGSGHFGSLPTGGGFSSSQLTTFDGVEVAKWIDEELVYARAHGWSGPITSGYRPGFDPHTVNRSSEHSLDIYPGGAVDFGGMVDPAGLANKLAFMRAAAGYPGPDKLIPAQGFRDDGHMSGTGHFRGGRIPDFAGAFANGGVAHASSPTMALFGDNGPETAVFIPQHKKGGKHFPGMHLPSNVRGGLGDPGSQQYFAALVYIGDQIAKALAGLTHAFSVQQTNAQNVSGLAGVLQGVAAGTSLKSLGLTGAGLKASGLTKHQAQALVGGGAAGFGVLAALDQQQATADAHDADQLKKRYAQAVKDHNKKLQKKILDQLGVVDAALAQAISDGQAARVQEIQTKAQAFSDASSAIGDTLSTLQGIGALTGGETLAGLGLSPAILKTLGLGSGAQGLVGSGLSNFQTLASNQGGSLTAAQLQQAQAGVTAQNAIIQQQESPLESELGYYQSQLPSLTGTNRTNAVAAMQQLAQQLLALQGTIDTNNQGLSDLTAATTANTSATSSNTGAMTGTTTFQYRGQDYLASDQVISVGVGG